MIIVEVIAFIFSLYSVWLTGRNNDLCWPVGIIGIFGFMFVFHNTGDWSNFFLQFIFLFQSFRGWLNWNKTETEIRNWSNKERILSISLLPTIFFSLNVIFYLMNIESSTLDVATTSLCMVAIYLLSKRIMQNWFFWIIADCIYIFLFYEHKLYLLSILYMIFLLLSNYGLFNWKKNETNSRRNT
jgi:nicotinamide mononucleotide transporter